MNWQHSWHFWDSTPFSQNCAVTNLEIRRRVPRGKTLFGKSFLIMSTIESDGQKISVKTLFFSPILLSIFRSCRKIARSAFIKLLLIGYSVFSELRLENTIELLQLAISLLTQTNSTNSTSPISFPLILARRNIWSNPKSKIDLAVVSNSCTFCSYLFSCNTQYVVRT